MNYYYYFIQSTVVNRVSCISKFQTGLDNMISILIRCRSGVYPVSLPFIPGVEGVGVVEVIGPDAPANSPAVGSLVAYYAPISGSYAGRLPINMTNSHS